ncbi:MAG: phenylacetate--CoA ligase family protein, partial [Planctomycetia bacterium]|nr:phenylacetate--CoA ligase family protein [Planctomycetia bacterium]
ADVLDHAGATEVGPWGVGDLQGGGLDVIETCFHPEFLALDTGRPALPGELAELVLTTLGRCGAPVIRYRTGDVVRPTWAVEGQRPWVRLEGGVLGRADDMLVVRGVNIFPGAIDDIVRSFPEVIEHRLIVESRGSLDEVEVVAVPIGSLPRFEGKGRRLVDHRRSRGSMQSPESGRST